MKSKTPTALGDMSVDEFMNNGFGGTDSSEDDDQSDDGPPPAAAVSVTGAKKRKNQNDIPDSSRKKKKKNKAAEEDDALPSVSGHKAQLERLKDKDPEFYQFLQTQNKDLLKFGESDDDDSGGSDVDDKGNDEGIDDSTSSEDESEEEGYRPPDKLEVASDSEGSTTDEDEGADSEQKRKKKKSGGKTLITLKMLKEWTKNLREQKTIASIHNLVQALKAAVQSIAAKSEEDVEEAPINFKVEGSTVFNAIVRLCMTDMIPTLNAALNVKQPTVQNRNFVPSNSSRWKKLRIDVRGYITAIIKLLSDVAEVSIVNVVLRHVYQLIPYVACFPKSSKSMLKHLITTWSTADETSRVLAFLCLMRLARTQAADNLTNFMKQMYMSFVKNCKFTSPTSLPQINFMQRSLVEVFSLDIDSAYQLAFVYIRQLAIHLRNAINTKKKESIQAVYNWQFIHCINFWTRFLTTLHPNDTLDPLIYPLTQTIIGTIKLVPAAKYYPLRFHCIRTLNTISDKTRFYIPVLPHILEVFELSDFNKKHTKASLKTFNFDCVLKLSKTQLQEKKFKDCVIEQVYDLLMEHFNLHSHSIGFPELVFPAVLQLKTFIKQCKVASFTKQIKQIVDKVQESSKTIQQRRKSSSIDITDSSAVDNWEIAMKQEGTPLGKFYSSWRKLRDREKQMEAAGKDQIVGSDNLPVIVRPNGPLRATPEERKEFSEIFDASSDEDGDDETRFLLKSERPTTKKHKTLTNSDSDGDADSYSDFDEGDLDQLAGSASEEEGSSGGEEEGSGDEEEELSDNDDDDDESEDEMSDIPEMEDVVEDFQFTDDDDSSCLKK
ncbi:nucleolar complex protein 2 homolog [Tubulanus polymorphus]|uniref:nucleolar complex protein 2 homolog n=1 Tax=Tubulanus polymorphus TaxID=672921 RepID=UPI003DA4CF86